MKLNQLTISALDIAAARDFYSLLGFTLIVDTDHYVRLEAPQGGATLSISKVDKIAGASGLKFYLELESAAALNDKVAALKQQGILFDCAPIDQQWLWREAWLKDPAGNRLCLYYAGENRLFPPWRVA